MLKPNASRAPASAAGRRPPRRDAVRPLRRLAAALALLRRPAGFLLLGGAILVLGSCVRIPITEDTLFQPKESVTIRTFDHPEATLEEVFFQSDDGTQINAWYVSRQDAEATVLFFGGYGFYLVQSKPYLDMFLEMPVNVFLLDYRGYGRSEGEPEVAALKADSLHAWEVVQRRFGAEPETLIVHGHSLGTFMATFVAEQRGQAALVLENPATSAQDWTRTAVPWYLRPILRFDIAESFEGESNLERIAGVEERLLVFAGTEDILTPPEMAEELHDAAESARSRELLAIEGGSHPDLHEFAEYRAAYRRLVEAVSGR
jgi:pimeloyl-ACP methyl ester carboxylesterase